MKEKKSLDLATLTQPPHSQANRGDPPEVGPVQGAVLTSHGPYESVSPVPDLEARDHHLGPGLW